MSLSRTLNRLFDEVRREAKRNPAFADRLDAVLRAHASARDIDPEVLAEAERDEAAPLESSEAAETELNPVAHFTREGADSLRVALAALPDVALVRLMGEHNLDPAGVAADLAGHDLVEHIVAQAEKRVERDRKLFDY
jgi:hypothetical protein